MAFAVMAMIGTRWGVASVGFRMSNWAVPANSRFALSDHQCGFEAVHVRHLAVHKHDVVPYVRERLDHVTSIGDHVDSIP
jgi:hypothetical protein